MDPVPNPPAPDPSADRWLFRCQVCGRARAVGAAEIVAHMDRGWPRCCGEVMSLYSKADLTDPDFDLPL